MPGQVGEFWSTGLVAEADRAHCWQEMLSATHLPWSVTLAGREEGAQAFQAGIRRWWIDDLALVDCKCGPCSGSRRHRQLADTEGEYIVALMTLAGRETVGQGGVEANLVAGDVVTWDSRLPARFRVWDLLTKRSLVIPRAALDEVTPRRWFTGTVRLPATSPATRLLTGYLERLHEVLPELDRPAIVTARNATLELLQGALRSERDVPATSTAWPALRVAMDRFIEQHLFDDTITPAALALAHGVSTRTVNRIFSATGQTVSDVIRMRRLARARAEVAESDRSITEIAHRWGFADTSHFSRSFKAHYGISPTDYRCSDRASGHRVGAPMQRSGAVVQGGAPDPCETWSAATLS